MSPLRLAIICLIAAAAAIAAALYWKQAGKCPETITIGSVVLLAGGHCEQKTQ
jgi:uncharacterized membrane protein YjjP (DUF1212 family)